MKFCENKVLAKISKFTVANRSVLGLFAKRIFSQKFSNLQYSDQINLVF